MNVCKTSVVAGLALLPLAVVDGAQCILTARQCENFPKFKGAQFEDTYGRDWLGIDNPSSCLRRAEDFHHWCGNGRAAENATVSATYTGSWDTQVYHPTACDPDWSLYGGHCYIHVWRAKTWWEAEGWCNQHGANLCSIHGKAENEFVFTLTKGLSSWIGYHDDDTGEAKEWSDHSKKDFDNSAKNCTGREHEADCAPKETAQQWYDWNGADRGTWVCKKAAKWGLRLLRNTTELSLLPSMDWEKLKVPILDSTQILEESLASQEEEEAAPKRKVLDLGSGPLAKDKSLCDDCD